MSRGPGCRQRALLAAVERLEPLQALRVVPAHATRSDAVAWRRAARALVLAGRARAVYRRRPDRRGRWAAVLCLTSPESTMLSETYPRRSPAWVAPPPITLESLPAVLQAAVLSERTDQPVSVSTANRAARAYREARTTRAA